MPYSESPAYRFTDLALRALLRTIPVTESSQKLALWWGYRYRPAPRVVRLRSAQKIRVDPADYLQLLIYYTGTFEEPCLRVLRRILQPGGAFMDAGANIGLFTLNASRAVGATGRVLSFEPAPPNIEAVRTNLQINGIHNVGLVTCGLGDAECDLPLGLPEGGNRGMFAVGVAAGPQTFTIRIRRMDDVVREQGLDRLDLIKMDIEGSEHAALSGGLETLKRFHPAILIELNDAALRARGSSAAGVRGLLEGLGYRGWLISRRGLQPLSQDASHECDECLFLHPDRPELAARVRVDLPSGGR